MGVNKFVLRRGTSRRAGEVMVLGEPGRESPAEGQGNCLEVTKGAAFVTLLRG